MATKYKSLFVLLLLLPIVVSRLASPAACQEKEQVYEILEEIRVFPEGNLGKWSIGDREFLANEDTEFDFDHPPQVGVLAEVEYVDRDGELIAVEIEPQLEKANDITDGPYVFWKDATTAEVIVLENGAVRRTVFRDLNEPRRFVGDWGSLDVLYLEPEVPQPSQDSWPAPSRLMVISDLEGQYEHTTKFLRNHGVIDEANQWNWKGGHLMLVGDLVDRGPQVTELMRFLRRLEREAEDAGGQVHYVLGNHEAMVMEGDVRYAHPKYHFAAERIGISYEDLYNAESDIGRWWRSKNAVVRVGEFLFVHAGYSPVLEKEKLSPTELNQKTRELLSGEIKKDKSLSVAEDPVHHRQGPLWYRGYFKEYSDSFGEQPTEQEIHDILERHQAKYIVIGHTVVDEVGPLDGLSQVISVDVKWTDWEKCQGLLVEGDKMYRLKNDGGREQIMNDPEE